LNTGLEQIGVKGFVALYKILLYFGVSLFTSLSSDVLLKRSEEFEISWHDVEDDSFKAGKCLRITKRLML
jgi:hypothetical protein